MERGKGMSGRRGKQKNQKKKQNFSLTEKKG